MATESEPASDDAPPAAPQIGIPRKTLIWIGVVTAALWAFAIHTGSLVFMIILGVLTGLLAFVLFRAYRFINKQKKVVGLLQGAATSPEARREALAKLSAEKDASSPTNVFARAQLMAADDPKAALELIEKTPHKDFPPGMQDDVALLKTQLYLGMGRTQDARKTADTINLDNPDRKQARSLSAAIIAEAWARTGKPKEALALADTVEISGKDAEQLGLQVRVVRVFAKFASNQRKQAEQDLISLADDDLNQLGRFLDPRFRVHPELQKLARSVLERNPGARKMAKVQGQRAQRR